MVKDCLEKIEYNVKINNILFWKLHFGEFFLCWNALYKLQTTLNKKFPSFPNNVDFHFPAW